jgi:hypothetical protein
VYATSMKTGKDMSEVEELAELPARAKDEEADLVTLIEISIRCANLNTGGKFTAIDPIVFIYTEEETGFQFKDKTETQTRTNNPAFIKTFRLAYSFEKQLRFKLDVYDSKVMPQGLPHKTALIGTNVFTVHEFVCSGTHSATKPLLNPLNKRQDLGTITVHSDDAGTASSDVEMLWRLSNNKYNLSLVLRIYRQSDNELVPVYQSEAKNNEGKL